MSEIWETQLWPQDWKRTVFIPIPKKGNAKECSNYHTIALVSHASKVMLKIFQARVQQYVNQELPDGSFGLRKGRGTRDQVGNIWWIIAKAREFQKNIYFCFIDYTKVFVWITTNWGKKEMGIPLWTATAVKKFRHLCLESKVMTNLDSIFKSTDITLPFI